MTEFRLLESESDGFAFRVLHNLLFSRTNASHEWFQWYFDHVADGNARVYGAFEDGLMIGCWCVEPKKFNTGEEIIDVGRCFAVGIHPNHRMKGLFIELSKFAIEQERIRGEYEYILGFPQVGKPVIAGHLKSGWDKVQTIKMRAWRPKPLNEPRSLKHVRFASTFFRIDTKPLASVGFIENATYRDKRWSQHPDNHYIVLSKLDAYIVLKPYGSACHILDMGGNCNYDVMNLIKTAQTLAWQHNWKEMTVWCADNDVYRYDLMLNDFGDENVEFGSSVELLAVRIKATKDLTFKGSVHFSMCSEEIY